MTMFIATKSYDNGEITRLNHFTWVNLKKIISIVFYFHSH